MVSAKPRSDGPGSFLLWMVSAKPRSDGPGSFLLWMVSAKPRSDGLCVEGCEKKCTREMLSRKEAMQRSQR